MNAVEKLRALVVEPMRDGRIRSEAYPETVVASVCGGPRITLGDCAELLQEIDRMRGALKSISERKCRGGWGGACGEADSAAREAEYALEPSP